MTDIVQDFVDAMVKAGCVPQYPEEIQPTGQDEYATLLGDKKPGRIGYCLTVHPDGFAHGNFISFKHDIKGKWSSIQNNKKITKEEKEAFVLRMKTMEADKQKRKESGYADAAKIAEKLWADSTACESHPYLTKKKVKSYGLRTAIESCNISGLFVEKGDLIIPLWQDGKISSFQKIDNDGVKLNQPGGKKSGSYFKIGNDTDVVCISEGYGTAASVHEATGFCTYAAVDAGNLMDVGLAVRKMHPDALIIFAADNDQWSVNSKGEMHNTGVEKAKQAAVKVNGFEVHPDFPPDDMDLRSDFNDLHTSEGLSAVKDKIISVVDAQPRREEAIEEDNPYVFEYGDPTIDENGDVDLTGDMRLPFKILGFNDGVYYYFPFGVQQIFGFTASAHTLNNLLQLASFDEWKEWAKSAVEVKLNPKEIATYAFDTMKQIAEKRGVFVEGNRVRGCGAWMDAGRVVLHCGDKLLVDGTLTSPRDLTSRYVYAAASQMLKHNAEPLSNKEAQELREICSMLKWENPLSGLLLSGWLVIAPVCAALAWRPHIWLRGEAGAGKTTVLDEIIRPVLGDIALNVDGGTTESAIRNSLKYDARPVIYDEAEGKGNKFSLMDGVLALAKLSSKGGVITKFGQKSFSARSSFCFSSINPPIKDFASETRISMMDLKKNKDPNAQEHFKKIMAKIDKTITPEYGRRMLSRTIKYMPILLKNIKTFRDAANSVIKDSRAADQVSAMLAGLYLLGSTKEITEQEAKDWISERDWTEHTAIAEEPDHERLLHYISTSIVNVKGSNGNRDYTIGTLISAAIGKNSEVGVEVAKSVLRQYSILARHDGIFFGNKNHNLEKILKDTDWCINWNKTLGRIAGSKSISNQYFSSGDKQRAMMIPAEFFHGERPAQQEMPIEEEEISF